MQIWSAKVPAKQSYYCGEGRGDGAGSALLGFGAAAMAVSPPVTSIFSHPIWSFPVGGIGIAVVSSCVVSESKRVPNLGAIPESKSCSNQVKVPHTTPHQGFKIPSRVRLVRGEDPKTPIFSRRLADPTRPLGLVTLCA